MSTNLKPDIVWIEGRCYRMNESSTTIAAYQEHDMYENESTMNDDDDEGDCDDNDDFEVTQLSESRYSTTFHVPKFYFGYIIGKRAATKIRLERETKTEIKIPKQGHDGDIVILGSSANRVKTARRRINMIIMSSRKKQRCTHFVSMRFNNDEIKENFIKFKELVLQDNNQRGLEESLFILPSRLHLTVCVMPLMDNVERLEASKLLTQAAEDIIRPSLEPYFPLRVRMKGISYMNDDPQAMHVLYANVQEENAPFGTLQKLSDDIHQYFYKAGYVNENEYGLSVKLHVTLINSKRRGRSQSNEADDSHEQPRKRTSFDGTRILDQFSDFDFGVAEVTEIGLMQIGSCAEDGYYQATCTVPCGPSN